MESQTKTIQSTAAKIMAALNKSRHYRHYEYATTPEHELLLKLRGYEPSTDPGWWLKRGDQ